MMTFGLQVRQMKPYNIPHERKIRELHNGAKSMSQNLSVSSFEEFWGGHLQSVVELKWNDPACM